MTETRIETQLSEQANQNTKLLNCYHGEFFERLALVGELSHMDEREQVEPWLLFSGKKEHVCPRLVRNELIHLC
jgi:hypothetical protein